MEYKQIEYKFNDSISCLQNWIKLVKWYEDESWKLDKIKENLVTFKK